MSSESSFDDLVGRLGRGDQDAATELFERYAGRLIALARSRLDTRLCQKIDPEDVLQSAFRSFFARHSDGKLELKNWESLWGLLVQITLRKCGRKVRIFRGPTRDIRREQGQRLGEDSSASELEFMAQDPSPSDAAVLSETVEKIMASLNERERQVLELRLQGYTVPEISTQVGRTEYTVYGVLARIRKRLRGLLDDAG